MLWYEREDTQKLWTYYEKRDLVQNTEKAALKRFDHPEFAPRIEEMAKRFEEKYKYRADHNAIKGYIGAYVLDLQRHLLQQILNLVDRHAVHLLDDATIDAVAIRRASTSLKESARPSSSAPRPRPISPRCASGCAPG